MTLVNGKITKAVLIEEIAECIGEDSLDLGTLCVSGKIQKYAKCKPLDRPTSEELTDSQRKASVNYPGCYWGLKVGTGAWQNIHVATWDYIDRPRGEINDSPYRQLDFAGYNHYAEPTLSGYSGQGVKGKVYTGSGTPIEAVLEWNITGNTDGIDVLQCTEKTSSDLKSAYLCVMVNTYCRAFVNDDAGGVIAPVYSEGTYCERFHCPDLDDTLKASATRTMTLFLADLDQSADNANIAKLKNGGWVNTSGLSLTIDAISIPDAVGYSVDFMLLDHMYGSWTVGDLLANFDGFSAYVECTESPEEDSSYQVVLQLGTQGQADIKTFKMTAGTTAAPFLYWSFSSNELPMVKPNATTTYDYTVALYGVDDAGVRTELGRNSGTVIFTVTGTGTN